MRVLLLQMLLWPSVKAFYYSSNAELFADNLPTEKEKKVFFFFFLLHLKRADAVVVAQLSPLLCDLIFNKCGTNSQERVMRPLLPSARKGNSLLWELPFFFDVKREYLDLNNFSFSSRGLCFSSPS